jgi:alkanesulfonate monooxygenase SsuD/methylene tetrahydromethanopterin reductase-like flavin-dependent oxidoreductase (luciferase family)
VFTRTYIRDAVLPELADSRCALWPYVVTAVAERTEQAREEARRQIAFYYTTRLYHSILRPHGWEAAGAAIASAFKQGDFTAMTEAVSDAMLDEIAIAGTPDEVRGQLEQWRDLSDHVLLYSPSVGMKPERVQENLDAIIDTFGI